MPKRRCLSCGTLATRTRCPDCQRAQDRERNATRQHYGAGYQARRNAMVTAWHDEGAACWLCGQPLRPDLAWPDPLSTTADHERPGDPDSPLRPSHASCNSARGNRPTA